MKASLRQILVYLTVLGAVLAIDQAWEMTLGNHPDGDCLDPRHTRAQ